MFLRIANSNLSNHKVEDMFSLSQNLKTLMNTSQLQVTNYISEIKLANLRFGKVFVDLFSVMMKL